MVQRKQKRRFGSAFTWGKGTMTVAPRGFLGKRPLKRRSLLISLVIIAVALVVSFAPLEGRSVTLTIVSGSELQEPLRALLPRFEEQYPNLRLDLQFQGSQELVNKYLDDSNRFTPAVLISANGQLLVDMRDRWLAQNETEPFAEPPRAIAKTLMVGIAWAERGAILFPSGQFDWQRLEQALVARTWGAIGGPASWGSFDFVISDPERSNSGQLSLALMAQAKLGGTLNLSDLSTPALQDFVALVKRSVYNPPRSSGTVVQEFIARGANDADVSTVYESNVLSRWQEAQTSQGQPYQIYYIDPSVETVSTGAIAQRNLPPRTIDAARQFLDFLTAPEQQVVFVQYGFRPVNPNVFLESVPDSPWSQNIPGVALEPAIRIEAIPSLQIMTELIRLWQRAS